MSSPIGVRRVILVVLDGLRPDAVDRFDLVNLRALARRGAWTFAAQTVAPSVTAVAMTSLLTGVPPATHGLVEDRFHIPRARGPVVPLPRVLAEAGLTTRAFLAELPLLYRGFARRVARQLGGVEACFQGRTAPEILLASRSALAEQRDGLFVYHWPDADRAGHRHGWMSAEYADAARRLDATLALLAAEGGAEAGGDTLIIVLADHGGGGVGERDHDSAHVLDRTIPIVLAGGHTRRAEIARPSSILDVAPTVCWALGLNSPPEYVGRVLDEGSVPVEAVA